MWALLKNTLPVSCRDWSAEHRSENASSRSASTFTSDVTWSTLSSFRSARGAVSHSSAPSLDETTLHGRTEDVTVPFASAAVQASATAFSDGAAEKPVPRRRRRVPPIREPATTSPPVPAVLAPLTASIVGSCVKDAAEPSAALLA